MIALVVAVGLLLTPSAAHAAETQNGPERSTFPGANAYLSPG